jgi:hypothetical protein
MFRGYVGATAHQWLFHSVSRTTFGPESKGPGTSGLSAEAALCVFFSGATGGAPFLSSQIKKPKPQLSV